MKGKTIYGYWGAGIEITVAKITGYKKNGDMTYFAAREVETNKVHYFYGSEIRPGPVPSYGSIAEFGGWYHEEAA